MKVVEIIKKDGTINGFDDKKIIKAVKKSAQRVMVELSDDELVGICKSVHEYLVQHDIYKINVKDLHHIVESTLDGINDKIASSYREYRNYKIDFVKMLDEVYKKAQIINHRGDKENSNTDSCLVSTKRSLIYSELNKELYNKFFLTVEERQACRDGYIYIHDKSARRDTMNCCLFDAATVIKGGFEMGNMWYNEPKTIDTACDVLGDVIMMSASMQYGGWSTRVDTLLASYCEKSFDAYYAEYVNIITKIDQHAIFGAKDLAHKYAFDKTIRDLEQGIQGLEYKLNSVASSRGDYPFTTFALGLDKSFWGKEVSKAFLRVRKEGQGKNGFKRPVLFPKLVFLYDENLHGEGKELEDVFLEGIETSSKCMYPDFLSLSGEGYVPSMYKEYGEVVYPMGCRAFLSPWFRKGGMVKQDETDTPVFTGRFNIGAVTLHLPMILQKSKVNNTNFYDELDYYLEMVRNLHIRTYEYLGNLKASTNPLGFCEGGFLGGNLKHNDNIAPLLPAMTASFGITALDEFEYLSSGKSLVEGGEYALEVMEYINKKVEEYKKADGWLYAIYGTPAESLCGLQVRQFKDKYGDVEGITDHAYTSNSFHCNVREEITSIEKQDLEHRFWNLFNGGKIQYVRYPIDYNKEAIITLVRRAMQLGYYEGINLALSYCNECGHKEPNMEKCPKCGTTNLTKIDRMNGYLSYSRVKGDTTLNDAKMAEIKERKSM